MDDLNDTPSMTDYIPLQTLQKNNNDTSLHSDPSKIADATNSSHDDQLQSASRNISLFPIFDLCLKIFPVYYTEGRNKSLSFLLISLCITVFIAMPCFTIYKSVTLLQSGSISFTDITFKLQLQQSFVFTMYFFPTLVQFLRLYFFAKHFTSNIWRIWRYKSIPLLNNTMSAVSTHHRRDNLSSLLQQPSNLKNKIRRRFNIGLLITFILYVAGYAVGTLTAIAFYGSSLTAKQRQINMIEQIVYFAVQLLFGALPDLLMLSVARLVFTECYLHISVFTSSFNVITQFSSKTSSLLDDVLSFDLHEKYLEMHAKISGLCRKLNAFVLCWVVMIAFYLWFLITLCFFTDWSMYASQDTVSRFMVQFYIHFAVYSVQATCTIVFMLWPAFRMTELFQTLQEKMKEQIQSLLTDRTYLHEEKLLNAITRNQTHGYVNTTEVYKNIALYSKQKACLEVLLQLTSTMNEKPCSYSLLRLTLDRYSIRNFIVVILVGKVTSFLWSGF